MGMGVGGEIARLANRTAVMKRLARQGKAMITE